MFKSDGTKIAVAGYAFDPGSGACSPEGTQVNPAGTRACFAAEFPSADDDDADVDVPLTSYSDSATLVSLNVVERNRMFDGCGPCSMIGSWKH